MPFLWTGFNLERALQGTDGMFLNPELRNGESSLKEKEIASNNGSWKSEADNFESASLNSVPFSTRYSSMEKKYNRLGSMSNQSSTERIEPSDFKINLSNLATKKGMITRVFKQETEHLTDEDLCKYLYELNNKKNSTLKRLKVVPSK